jgi:3-oxoacyl-[acyl-carrier protein] reductase
MSHSTTLIASSRLTSRAYFVATQEAARRIGEGDRMINIGSINSERVHFAGGSLYVLTKATVAGLTSTLRAIWARAGITINIVQPG